MIIKNITHNKLLASDAHMADTFFARLKGLLGTRLLLEGSGLIICPCSSIHTFGMKYAIDVLFVNQLDRVVKIESALTVGKFSVCGSSSYVIELPAGIIASTATTVGDIIVIS